MLITFGLTWGVELAMIFGWHVSFVRTPPMQAQLIVAAVMFAPALAAFITARFITREGFAKTGLRFGPFRAYVQVYFLIPAIFIAAYALTWLLGLGRPDWALRDFMKLVGSGFPAGSAPAASTMLLVIALGSITFAPLVNSLVAFGEEFGWRGYLLPKLLPLGKWRAMVISGVIWGLWHAPIVAVGFNYPGYPILGVLLMTLLATFMGVYLAYLRIEFDSTALASFGHGVFNSQGYGIWRILFPAVNPVIGGFTGVVGLLVQFAVAAWTYRKIRPAALQSKTIGK
ncbi:MAG: CPBP family glutamic-type intramembrane protease [Firmicutes bacterium]|nr:CPBP family glutamic-type intramembrane protease [Bacillota bacterium]